jgi:hypothetical protein
VRVRMARPISIELPSSAPKAEKNNNKILWIPQAKIPRHRNNCHRPPPADTASRMTPRHAATLANGVSGGHARHRRRFCSTAAFLWVALSACRGRSAFALLHVSAASSNRKPGTPRELCSPGSVPQLPGAIFPSAFTRGATMRGGREGTTHHLLAERLKPGQLCCRTVHEFHFHAIREQIALSNPDHPVWHNSHALARTVFFSPRTMNRRD